MLHLIFSVSSLNDMLQNIDWLRLRLRDGRTVTLYPNDTPVWQGSRCTWRNIKLEGISANEEIRVFDGASLSELSILCDPERLACLDPDDLRIFDITIRHHNHKDSVTLPNTDSAFQLHCSPLPEWTLPISWKAVGSVKIRAASLNDARDMLFGNIQTDTASLYYCGAPIKSEYVDISTLQIDPEGHPLFQMYFQQAIRELYNGGQLDLPSADPTNI